MLSDPIDTSLIAELRSSLDGWRDKANAALALVETMQAREAELEQLVEALRCGDLVNFAAGELAPDRAEAFREHLVRCTACQVGLVENANLDARLSALAADREPR